MSAWNLVIIIKPLKVFLKEYWWNILKASHPSMVSRPRPISIFPPYPVQWADQSLIPAPKMSRVHTHPLALFTNWESLFIMPSPIVYQQQQSKPVISYTYNTMRFWSECVCQGNVRSWHWSHKARFLPHMGPGDGCREWADAVWHLTLWQAVLADNKITTHYRHLTHTRGPELEIEKSTVFTSPPVRENEPVIYEKL